MENSAKLVMFLFGFEFVMFEETVILASFVGQWRRKKNVSWEMAKDKNVLFLNILSPFKAVQELVTFQNIFED